MDDEPPAGGADPGGDDIPLFLPGEFPGDPGGVNKAAFGRYPLPLGWEWSEEAQDAWDQAPRPKRRPWNRHEEPSISYETTLDLHDNPEYRTQSEQFYEQALEVFRALTTPEEWVWAIDDDYWFGCRFWPHKAEPGTPWPIRSPGPLAYYAYYAPTDFSWQMSNGWSWLELSGQTLISAFPQPPRLYSVAVPPQERFHRARRSLGRFRRP
jgi:hypothetical protein